MPAVKLKSLFWATYGCTLDSQISVRQKPKQSNMRAFQTCHSLSKMIGGVYKNNEGAIKLQVQTLFACHVTLTAACIIIILKVNLMSAKLTVRQVPASAVTTISIVNHQTALRTLANKLPTIQQIEDPELTPRF